MSTDDWIAKVTRQGREVRLRVLKHTIANNGGYLSQACSAGDLLCALYSHLMHLGPSQAPAVPLPFPGVPSRTNNDYYTGAAYNGPHNAEYDRFFLSPSQYALVAYATLVAVGRMSEKGLAQFNQDGSSVEMIGAEHSPGMEVTSGSLGITISQAAGVAWARKRKGERGRVWVFMSDGEFQVGQVWEAMQAMAFHQLHNMTVVVDINGQQCDGRTAEVMQIEPLSERLEAFGCHPQTISAHELPTLAEACRHTHPTKPTIVLAYSDPCYEMPILRERIPKLHYVRFTDPEQRRHYEQLFQQLSAAWGIEV